MTCRPNEEPPKYYADPVFNTTCYRCGRPMKIVKVWTRKWRCEYMTDEDYWTHKGTGDKNVVLDDENVLRNCREK